MQWDDDSYITGPLPYNLVQKMDAGNYSLAARELATEPPLVVWGLAELTKYFIQAHAGGCWLMGYCVKGAWVQNHVYGSAWALDCLAHVGAGRAWEGQETKGSQLHMRSTGLSLYRAGRLKGVRKRLLI